jgi:6,7-dimethyl-8-ribityllumazine synthase
MPPSLQDTPSAALRITILVARFNEAITRGLLDGALATLREKGLVESSLQVEWVPGAVELPLAAAAVIRATRPDAVLTLGAVIRGDTDHYEHVSRMVADGVMRTNLDFGVPVAFGVLTCANEELALARSGPNSANKGREAALAALEMIELLRRVGPTT